METVSAPLNCTSGVRNDVAVIYDTTWNPFLLFKKYTDRVLLAPNSLLRKGNL